MRFSPHFGRIFAPFSKQKIICKYLKKSNLTLVMIEKTQNFLPVQIL